MIYAIAISCILGMVIPALVFTITRKIFKKRWSVFLSTAGLGMLVAFALSYTFYLQFIR